MKAPEYLRTFIALDQAQTQRASPSEPTLEPLGIELRISEGATSLSGKGSGTDGHRVWKRRPPAVAAERGGDT